jgi:hypothetical protein
MFVSEPRNGVIFIAEPRAAAAKITVVDHTLRADLCRCIEARVPYDIRRKAYRVLEKMAS